MYRFHNLENSLATWRYLGSPNLNPLAAVIASRSSATTPRPLLAACGSAIHLNASVITTGTTPLASASRGDLALGHDGTEPVQRR